MNDPHSYPHLSSRLPPKDQLIMGIQTIREVLTYFPDRFIQIFTAASNKTQSRKHDLLLECEKKKIPILYVSSDLLTKMAGSDSHQSFVAHIKGRKFFDVNEFIEIKNEQDKVFVLMLSEIFDPQNFGAILRSAEYFRVDGVVWSKNRGTDLTPLVSKTSCGASEILPLIRISNLGDSVDKFKEAGFEIVATIADPKAEPIDQFHYAPKTVLIVGSEGEGIQPLLLQKADRFLTILSKGKIQSLNVAQATAVFLSKI